ncbi:hypothetical protein [Undibacterium sp. RuRC25W]|uniref:hypothetical protein n=1 Tax=Undibacterium sp. RuRC25W TaxID=3413047 RepID=UPI003BEFC58E
MMLTDIINATRSFILSAESLPETVTQPRNKEVRVEVADEAALDEALKETFPASDPIAVTFTPVEKK